MLNKIKNWWQDEIYYLKDVLPAIRYKRHWTSKIVHILIDFYLIYWKFKWCIF